jgi:hypothetical protein
MDSEVTVRSLPRKREIVEGDDLISNASLEHESEAFSRRGFVTSTSGVQIGS